MNPTPWGFLPFTKLKTRVTKSSLFFYGLSYNVKTLRMKPLFRSERNKIL